MRHYSHDLEITHTRAPLARSYGEDIPDYGEARASARGDDLTAAVRELLTRMPSDLYAAFRVAFIGDQRDARDPESRT